MDRRRYIQIAAGVTVVGLSGCAGILGSDSSDGPNSSGDSNAPNSSDETPDGESYVFEGTDDGLTEPFALEQGLVAVDFHNFGFGHVNLELREAGADRGPDLVNEATEEAFDGTGAARADAEGEYQLDVSANQWEVTIRQPRFSEAEYEAVPFEVTETDYALLGPFEFETDTEVTLATEDEFGMVDVLSLEGVDGGQVLSVSDDNGYQTTATVGQSGPGMLRVQALLEWSLTVENP